MNWYSRIIFDFIDDDNVVNFIIGYDTIQDGEEFVSYYNSIEISKSFVITPTNPVRKYYKELDSIQPKPLKSTTPLEFDLIINKLNQINLDWINKSTTHVYS